MEMEVRNDKVMMSGKCSLRHVFCYQSLTDDIEQNEFGQLGPTLRQMEGDDVDLNRNRKS